MSNDMSDSGVTEGGNDSDERLLQRKLIHDVRNGLASVLMQAQLLSHLADIPGTDAAKIKKLALAIEERLKATASLLDDA